MARDAGCSSYLALLPRRSIVFLMALVAIVMLPRTVARFSGAALQPLFAVARTRDPAVLSPLFGRPLCTTVEKKVTATIKAPVEQNQNVTLDPANNDSATPPNQNVTAVKTSTTKPDSKDHKESLHGALHQVEHRASEKGGIELSRLATEEALKILKRSAERGALERRALERGAERAAERIGERATERAGQRALEHAAEISAERTAERVGERAAERISERVTERVGERVTERVGERVTERVGERALEQGISKGVARPLALTIPERVALRIGRGVLIALPALGGIFALYLLKMDKTRAIVERKNGSRSTFILFGGAAVTDAVDAVCHFAIAYGVFHEFSHHLLAQLEEVSLGCAFFSTLCAVMGEVVAYRKRKKVSATGKESEESLSPPPNAK